MTSMIDPRTDPTPPPDDRTDSALGQRSAVVAAVGWVVVAGSAVGALASPDSRELLGCVALMAFFVAYGFSTRAVFFAACSPTASRCVLFLEGMRRRITDEPHIGTLSQTN